MIYLDNAATTPVDKEVAAVITKSLEEDFANPSSLYKLGAHSESEINAARQTVAGCINAQREEIYFTSCASESNNLAIYGLALARKGWANRIVTTGYEHPAVRKPLELLKEAGFEIVYVNPDAKGNVSKEEILAAVNETTALVSLIHVNNETGAVIDLKSLCREIKEKNHRTAVHIDATQSFMKLPIDVSGLQIETLSFSGHKINAPKGIGGLYIRKGTNIKAVMVGGGQEKGVRAGTENIHYIKGLAKACQLLKPNINKKLEHYTHLKNQLLEGLMAFDNVVINSPEDGVPYTVNFSFLGYKSETLLHFLEQYEIYVSSGSACSKGGQSHTLAQMGLSSERIDSALRVSFGTDTTDLDIERLLEILKLATEKLQRKKQ
ncbi:MAG: cysteine desulfurase family protein [Oscillospiraceae bacterium]